MRHQLGQGTGAEMGTGHKHMISMEYTNIFLFIIIHNASRGETKNESQMK